MTLDEFRKRYPQYDDMSDDDLADKLYNKYYSNKDKEEFFKEIGLNKTGLIESAGAGVVSGLAKAGEGITTLGTALVDLGLNTNLTEKVEKAFDDNDFLSKMEDLADDRWTGTMTEILTQLGVPGGVALKGANVLLKSKKLGTLGRSLKKMPAATRMAAVGGAELAAATEDLGTIGDAFGLGFTETREREGESGRREAIRRLENKFKFGLEGALGFGLFEKAVIPGLKFTFSKAVPALKGILTRSTGGADRVTRMVDEIDPVTQQPTGRKVPQVLQLDEGFQFNRNVILRTFDRLISGFRARGNETREMFEARRKMIGEGRADLTQVTGLIKELEETVQKLVRPLGGKLDEVDIKKREEIMENIYDYLTAPKNAKDASKIPSELFESVNKIRSHVDNLSMKLMENPLAQGSGDAFIRTVAANVGEYLTRSYRTFGSETKNDWINTLYNTDKGRQIIERAKIFLAERDPASYGGTVIGTGKNRRFVPSSGPQGEAMDAEIRRIIEAGDMSKLGPELVRLKSVDNAVFSMRQQVPKEIRELLGEIKDPTVQLLETSSKINNFINSSKYFQKVLDDGYNRYIFDESTISQGGQKFNVKIETDAWNPLNGKYTTQQIADSIGGVINTGNQNSNLINSFYNGILLAPKALIQESKTTLSPITHFRNVISAVQFSAVNGNLFSPATFAKSFKITRAITKGQLETQAGRKLFKSDEEYKRFLGEYMEMQRLGIVNTSARLGDLKSLIDDMSAGLENIDNQGRVFNVLKRFNEKTGLRRLREGARTLYSAEDDFYKIQNYFAEQSKYRKVFDELYEKDPNAFVRKYGEIAREKYGITNLFDKKNYNQFIKENAADIVRNNIPNYDYVGSYIRGLRKLPFGNFVSFPAEILRTGINTIVKGVEEFRDPLTRGIGFKRLLGMGAFGIGAGKGVEETAQLLTGVTNETINSLKEFLPEWSQNSTLIPIKQDGQIYYIDYSHTNAYDFLTRPLNAAMNGVNQGITNEEGFIGSVEQAAYQAGREFLQPFVSEAIITEFYTDVFARGGETKEGRRIWNPTDSPGEKVLKTIGEFAKVSAPGSFNQFYRLYLSGIGKTQQYNRGYKFLNEASGILGFRIQNPFVQQGLNFKISDNQKDIKNAEKVFKDAVRDGNSTTEDIVKAYQEANERKKDADKVLYRKIKAAENLGLSKNYIKSQLTKRYSKVEANRLINNLAIPFKISKFDRTTIRDNALLRNKPNPLAVINSLVGSIYSGFMGQNLFENPDSIFDKPLQPDLRQEDRTPNVILPAARDAYGANPDAVPGVPLSLNIQPTGGTISTADRSQLAKSGDIDITEAIANRG